MRDILMRGINPRPLAVARILVGLVAFGFTFEWIRVLLRVSSGNYLTLPVVVGTPSPGRELVLTLFAISLGASAAMILGLAGRVPAITVALTTAAVLLLDQQTYSNHMVLLFMLALFLGMSDSTQALSLSRSRHKTEVTYWPAFLIKSQISVLYAWTAIAKINPQYLSGEVLGTFMQPWVPVPDGLLPAAAILSVVTEAILAVALWIPEVRIAAFVLGGGLHIGIVVALDSPAPLIGFGLLMLSGYVLFASGSGRTYTPASPKGKTAQLSAGI
ncbi:HTTM domain-containing protein [Pseudarthrobacter sulfonivorans]|uniref:HTTM domain-containing protein n=1 Tax=Pseudarthrobacter sulfonivorans TaxID=121292 RepID=UPI002789AED6|nr:HTTM domain-containing protein [Pseudarthrobacter sulfonivorans]MDP9997756.1 hypothetical protein [Pseudarthrobacter sulfonivorans]